MLSQTPCIPSFVYMMPLWSGLVCECCVTKCHELLGVIESITYPFPFGGVIHMPSYLASVQLTHAQWCKRLARGIGQACAVGARVRGRVCAVRPAPPFSIRALSPAWAPVAVPSEWPAWAGPRGRCWGICAVRPPPAQRSCSTNLSAPASRLPIKLGWRGWRDSVLATL